MLGPYKGTLNLENYPIWSRAWGRGFGLQSTTPLKFRTPPCRFTLHAQQQKLLTLRHIENRNLLQALYTHAKDLFELLARPCNKQKVG